MFYLYYLLPSFPPTSLSLSLHTTHRLHTHFSSLILLLLHLSVNKNSPNNIHIYTIIKFYTQKQKTNKNHGKIAIVDLYKSQYTVTFFGFSRFCSSSLEFFLSEIRDHNNTQSCFFVSIIIIIIVQNVNECSSLQDLRL